MLHSRGETGCNKNEFGDKRLEQRMETILEQITEKPHSTVPQAIEGQHQVKACYRFWDNKKVKPDKILKHHVLETIEVASQEKIILIPQDTSDLDFSNLKRTKGLGYLENKYLQGIKVHTALAISESGLPLGILWQKQWTRPNEEYGKKAKRNLKPTQEKESQRWIDCHNEINRLLPEDITKVHITDREGDIYDMLSSPRTENEHLLLRFAQDRRIEGEEHRIKTALESQPIAGKYTVHVGRRGLEQPRDIELSIKYMAVEIKPPQKRYKDKTLKTVKMTAIKAYEEGAEKETQIEWNLLTTLPVTGIEDTKKYVKYYTMRWLIERYHFTLKSGCQVEDLQLETAQRLENAVATYCIAAYRIMYMAYLARIEPEMDARVILTEDEITALCLKFGKDAQIVRIPVKTAVIWIARLGGFLARKSDGMPGVKTLWRGIYALEFLVEGFCIARISFTKLSKNDSSPLSLCPRTYG